MLDVAGLGSTADPRVLDVGCGNGRYLAEMDRREVRAGGCDLSLGMLAAAGRGACLANSDATALPFPAAVFDIVLAPHMLYHVADRRSAVQELRRVLRPGGRCVVVTNGRNHMRSLRALVESAVGESTSGWQMRDPSTHVFSLDNGGDQLRTAFERVECIRTEAAPVQLTEAAIAATYVASVEDHYQPETSRPWHEVVEHVRTNVQHQIDTSGSFVIAGDTGAFVCS